MAAGLNPPTLGSQLRWRRQICINQCTKGSAICSCIPLRVMGSFWKEEKFRLLKGNFYFHKTFSTDNNRLKLPCLQPALAAHVFRKCVRTLLLLEVTFAAFNRHYQLHRKHQATLVQSVIKFCCWIIEQFFTNPARPFEVVFSSYLTVAFESRKQTLRPWNSTRSENPLGNLQRKKGK